MEYLYLLICLAVIVFSADALVAGAVTIAKRFKISDFVIGAVIVGVGTSFPELVVSSIGAIEGNSDIAIGNVVGSNIFNILGILGLTALIMPVAVSKENKRFDLPLCIGLSLLTLLLVFNFFVGGEASISRIDGLVLLAIGLAGGGKMRLAQAGDYLLFGYMVVATCASYMIWYTIVQRYELSKLFITKLSEPVFAAIIGAIILKEDLLQWHYIGAFLCIATAVVISNLTFQKWKKPIAPSEKDEK